MKLYYHGTKEKGVKRILRQGFPAGTYFAKHLEYSVAYGDHNFIVRLKRNEIKQTEDRREVVSLVKIPKERIEEYNINICRSII